MGEKREADAESRTQNGENERFREKHSNNIKTGKAESLQNANLARALHHHRVHVEQHDDEADDNPESHHGSCEWAKLRQIGRIHERDVFRERTDAVLGQQFGELRPGGAGISFAADIKHGHAPLGAGNLLRGADGNEKSGALAVSDDATDRKYMIQKRDLAADL